MSKIVGYRLEFNVKPRKPGYRYVWPILFKTRQLAKEFTEYYSAVSEHIHRPNVFYNIAANRKRGRIVSCSIEPVHSKS